MTVEQKFFKACELGLMEEVIAIITKLDDIDVKSEEGWTGLVRAVYNEHLGVAKLLVTHGANVNATNAKGTTIFMYAKTPVFQSKKTEILDWLLEEGAHINTIDMYGLTVLDYVKRKEALWLEQWLRTKGALYASEL